MDDYKGRLLYALEKEIEGVSNLRNIISDDLFNAIETIQKRKGKIIVTGVGKSGFIGMKFVSTLVSLGHTAHFLHPVEALHGDSGLVRNGDVVIAFSFSGASSEIIKIATYLKKTFEIDLISVTKNKETSLGKISSCTIPVPVREEGSPLDLAPMASTTVSLVIGDLIAAALTSPENFDKEHFAKFHPGGSLGLRLQKVKMVMDSESLPMVKEGDSLGRVAQEITRGKRGIVVVMGDKEVSGVITDGDIRRCLVEKQDISKISAADVMTRNPKTVTEDMSLYDALSLMEEFKITNLFVVDSSGSPKGIVHIHDLVENGLI